MKKSLLSFVIPSRLHKITILSFLFLTIGVGNVWGQSTTYTSNVTFTAGTNGSNCKVNIGSKQYDGMKLGTSSKSGTMTFTVPEGTTTIHIHAAGWNNDGNSRTLNISTSRGTLASGSTSMSLTNDTGVSSSSPFTLATSANASSSYYKVISISGVTGGEATITLTTSAKRAVVWGINAVSVSTPTLTCEITSLSFKAENGGTDTKTFTFSGSDLTANVELAVTGTNADMFSVTPNSVSKGSGTITNQSVIVTYSPTAVGSHSATLTISSTGVTSKTITLSGTVTAPLVSHKAYFYNGTTLLNEGGTPFAEGAAVSYSGSTPESCDTGTGASTTFAGWATDTWSGKVAKNAIIPSFYEGALPVMGTGDVNYYAVFCKGGSASELFSWEGGTSSDLTNLENVSASGLGTDYASSNAPYRVKLDDTGDNITITTTAAIGSITVGVKMIGGANASSIKVQESADANGTFTDVETLSISGSQNDVLNLSTSNAFTSTSRAVKLVFTKGSNVGVGPISIRGVASASNYMTTCCSNGYTYTINAQNVTTSDAIPANTCEGDVAVTYTANDGYHLPASIIVSNAGDENDGWMWDSSDGILLIDASKVTDNVTVSIIAEANSCSSYSFHQGTDGQSDWAINCFDYSDNSDRQWILNATIANKSHYYVGKQGNFYNDNLGNSNAKSYTNEMQYMQLALDRSHNGNNQLGSNYAGVQGTLLCYDNSPSDNLFVDFLPAGYYFILDAEGTPTALPMTCTNADMTAANILSSNSVWETAIQTVTDVSKKYTVGIKADATIAGKAWQTTRYNTNENMTTLQKRNSSGGFTGTLAAADVTAGTRGKYRIWADNFSTTSGEKNWYAHFVPYYYVTYNGNGASGNVAASADVSCEGDAAARTVQAAANGFTAPAHTSFGGWATSAANAAAGTVAYAEGANITLTADVELFAIWTPEANATITLNNYTGSATTAGYYAGDSFTLPSTNSYSCNDKTFVGWSTVEIANSETKPASNFYEPGASVTLSATNTFYAVFAEGEDVEDELNNTNTVNSTSNSYSEWSDVSVSSDAVYAGQSAGEHSSIQLRSNNSNSGIVTTTSGGKATKVVVEWNSNSTSGRVLDIYGKNSAYEDATDLYNASNQGTKLGSITYGTSTELTITGDYDYIGLRSNSGAMYIDKITITWSNATNYSTNCVACNEVTVSYADPGSGHSMAVKKGSTGINNNDAVRTCSAVTLSITLTPALHYTAAGLTAKIGSTDMSQSHEGNVYTVTIPKDATGTLTLTPTFALKSTHVIIFNDNGNASYTREAYDGEDFILPTEGISLCEDADFLGWVSGDYTDHATGVSSSPAGLLSPGTTIENVISNQTFTAVYKTTASGIGDAGSYTLNYDPDVKDYTLSYGSTINVRAEDGSDWMVKAYKNTGMQINTGKSSSIKIPDCPNAITSIIITGNQAKAVGISADDYSGSGDITYIAYGTDSKSQTLDLSGVNITGGYIVPKSGSIAITQIVVNYGAGSTIYTSRPTCCTPPTTPLTLSTNINLLVGSGEVHLSISGGNGQNIQWSSTGGTLTDQTNTGATLTLPAAATTQTYTVTITQPADEGDEQTICGATRKVTITVKANYTITFKTIESGSESTYNTLTITDGENYQFPDLSEDYTCEENYSFAGWASSSSATAVEKTAGNTATATGNATWYAVWRHSTSVSYETRDKYELVTDASTLAANQVFVIGYANGGVALAQMTQDDEYGSPVAVDYAADNSYLTFAAGTGVMVLSLRWYSGSGAGWYFLDNSNPDNGITYSGKGGSLQYTDGFWTWNIAVSSTNNYSATISDVEEEYTNYSLQFNSSNSRFAFYSSSQKKIQLYRKHGTIQVEIPGSGSEYSTNNEHCDKGATIRANNDEWVTSAAGQTVKKSIQVIAKNFSSAATLSASSSNEHFSVSLENTSVPVGAAGLTTNLIVAYTPVAADVTEETTVTLSAGDATKQIIVNGRSLPDEFVIITEKNGKWYALPANMKSGAGIYDGIEVTPNGSITQVPAAPSTAIYKLRSAANLSDKVRLVGNDNKCLWGNSTAGNTNIQNYAALANTNGAQYEWTLSTTDGETYQITLAAHPDTESGRQLAYGTAFGYYKTASIFYLLPVGCSSQPSNLEVSARRVDATFSWNSNASQTKIEIFLKSNGSKIKEVIVTASPKFIDGLSETTEYTYKLTPDGSESCAVTGEFKTTGPTIDLVEWQENAAIIQVDKDENVHPVLIVQGEKESGLGGTVATDLFFAKYFEGAGSMKLMSIFNGTRNAISLENYMIRELHAGNGASSYGTPKIYDLSSLGSINAGQEIILFTRPQNSAAESHLYDCSEDFLNEMAKKSAVTDNPRWIECDGTTFVSVIFNGNDALQLLKNGTPIDIIGASNAPVTSTSNCRGETAWTGRVKNMDYGKTASDFPNLTLGSNTLDDYSINTTDEEIDIYSARCIIFRNKTVTSGANAVANNTATFATFTPSEWSGRNVCKTKDECTALGWTYLGSDGKTYTDNSASTCNSYQDLGEFDYNSYYKDYNGIETKELDNYTHDTQTHTYTIPIENMKQYACLNLKFQLASNTAAAEILTEQVTQVPIVVTGNKATTDDIFSKVIPSETNPYPYYDDSKDRCKDCDVIVLGEATLTKAADNATHDVPQVGNIKVYPGGQLIIPAGTNYTATSLSIRRQEDEISTVNLQKSGSTTGNLTLQNSKGVYLDLRIDPTNWHYVTLPFDCNIDEVTYSNGTPAKLGTDWLCAWYDGDYRAAHQDGGWTDMQPGSTLEMGKGYIISLPGTGKVKQELRFPMAKSVLENEHTDKTIEGLYAYGAGMKGADGKDLRWNHRGWNMIGNPYMTYYNASSITTPLQQGTLEKEMEDGRWTGNWELNTSSGKDLRYVVAPINNGWAGYQQQTIGDNLPPFTCYFVQIGGDNAETAQGVNFDAANTKHSIVRRPQAETELDDSPVWLAVELQNPRGETDETTLLISDRFTDDYDVMDDLVKMRGSYYQYSQITTAPVLASRNAEGEMAFNALPDATAKTGVALNYFAAERGQYTLSLSRKYSLDNIDEVWLYDSVEQIWHDLLLSDYSFSSARTDDKSRFTLTVRVRRQPKITTDISDISSLSDLRIVTGDRRLSVLSVPAGADLWIFDSSGKLIDERLSVSADRLLFDVPASGVYNVRVVTADSAVTLKAVVK